VGKNCGDLKRQAAIKKTEALDLSLMWKVKEKLEEEFLEKDKLKDEEMTYGAISGMVSALGDPYTVF